jgi:hypothetical protein
MVPRMWPILGDPARIGTYDRQMPNTPAPHLALWRCPRCGRTFANRNQAHTCAALTDLDRHFAGKDPSVRASFDRIVAAISTIGPVEVLAEQTRIALIVRMSFAAFTPRKRWLDGHLVLARRVSSQRFRKVEVYSPRNVLHTFRIASPDEVDDEFEAWLAEAYAVGEQRCCRPARQTGVK